MESVFDSNMNLLDNSYRLYDDQGYLGFYKKGSDWDNDNSFGYKKDLIGRFSFDTTEELLKAIKLNSTYLDEIKELLYSESRELLNKYGSKSEDKLKEYFYTALECEDMDPDYNDLTNLVGTHAYLSLFECSNPDIQKQIIEDRIPNKTRLNNICRSDNEPYNKCEHTGYEFILTVGYKNYDPCFTSAKLFLNDEELQYIEQNCIYDFNTDSFDTEEYFNSRSILFLAAIRMAKQFIIEYKDYEVNN